MKKLIIALILLFFGVCAMAYFYFANLRERGGAEDLPIAIASAKASIVFSYDNNKSYYEIINEQSLLGEIVGKNKLAAFRYLYQLANQHQNLSQTQGKTVYIGFVANNNDIDFVLTTTFDGNWAIPRKDGQENTKTDRLDKIYTLATGDSINLFALKKENTIVISNNQQVLNASINHDNQRFKAYIKQNRQKKNNSLATVFINLEKGKEMAKALIGNINGKLALPVQQKGFAALYYNFGKEKLILNGHTEPDQGSYLSLFTNQQEQKLSIDKILPQHTANYYSFVINDYPTWRIRFTDYLKAKNLSLAAKSKINTIKQQYRIDLEQVFPKYFNKQLITFQTSTGEKYGAVALTNGEKTAQLLLDMSTAYQRDIRIFNNNKILYYYFGEPLKEFDRPFYLIIDNHLVFANHASSLQSFINSYRSNNLLVNTSDYQHYLDQLSALSTVCFYINQANSSQIFEKNLRKPYWKQLHGANYSSFCYQLSADKGKFTTNLLLLKKVENLSNNKNPDSAVISP